MTEDGVKFYGPARTLWTRAEKKAPPRKRRETPSAGAPAKEERAGPAAQLASSESRPGTELARKREGGSGEAEVKQRADEGGSGGSGGSGGARGEGRQDEGASSSWLWARGGRGRGRPGARTLTAGAGPPRASKTRTEGKSDQSFKS